MSKAIAIFMLLCCSAPAWAEVVESDFPPVLELFEAPARELGFPKSLAVAIAGVESGLSPWVLNVEGHPFRFDSKEKALEKAGQAWAAGQSFDLGLMQVNSQWLRRYGISPEAALDPLANIYFGGWILKQEIERHRGDIRAAVGAYHSPTPARASRYADQVMDALKRGPQPAKMIKKIVPAAEAPETIMPSGSNMLVVSQKLGLAVTESMKASATSPSKTMKVIRP